MLSINDHMLLDSILNWENFEEAIQYLIFEASKQRPDICPVLLGLIPQIAANRLKRAETEQRKKEQALHLAVCSEQMDTADPSYFAAITPICMEVFPDGTADKHCEAEKRYFENFKLMLMDKKYFDFKRDASWAHQYGYEDYLLLVRKKILEEA